MITVEQRDMAYLLNPMLYHHYQQTKEFLGMDLQVFQIFNQLPVSNLTISMDNRLIQLT
jgi:hypothetical protein